VLALSQDEAVRFNHPYIGTEHLLLGLAREGEGVAARVLDSLGVQLGELRRGTELISKRGGVTLDPATIELSSAAKTAFALAREEKLNLGQTEIRTEHLLLGLLRENGKGLEVIHSLGLTPEKVRHRVLATIGPRSSVGSAPETLPDDLGPDSRQVLTDAREEAVRGGRNYLGSEHLLLALRRHTSPVLTRVWAELGLEIAPLRQKIEAAIPLQQGAADYTFPMTARVAKIIAMAHRTAAQRKQTYVPPELLLIALLDEGGGIAARILANDGITAQQVREIVDRPT
jgi:ATP-dependent Clp protease ATP-binding subunit ClpA